MNSPLKQPCEVKLSVGDITYSNHPEADIKYHQSDIKLSGFAQVSTF